MRPSSSPLVAVLLARCFRTTAFVGRPSKLVSFPASKPILKRTLATADCDETKLTSGISHVGLSVSNLDASLKFFEALQYEKVGENKDYPAYFISNGSSLLTLWQTEPDATPFDRRNNVGLHHLAIKVPSLEALYQAYEAVQQIEGVRLDGEGAFAPQPLRDTWTHAMMYEPSGNRIELTYHHND